MKAGLLPQQKEGVAKTYTTYRQIIRFVLPHDEEVAIMSVIGRLKSNPILG